MTVTAVDTHECAFCPVEVRALYAASHNAANAIEDALAQPGNWSRAVRKVAELRSTLRELQPTIDRHFEAAP